MEFYPESLQPPEKLITSRFMLRPLRATDVTLDYEAVMESTTMLRLAGGGTWPVDDFTLEGNLEDLARHEEEHLARVAFTYTVMDPDERTCLGCVYVNQLAGMVRLAGLEESMSETIDDQQAIVRFWVRQSRLKEDLDWHLLKALIGWLGKQWRFSLVYFQVNDRDERQKNLMTQAGLLPKLTLDVPERRGPFLTYGPVAGLAKEGAQ